MAEEERELTPDIKIPTSLFDRVAGLLVLLTKAEPVEILYDIKKLREVSQSILQELQPLRGPWAVCYLCKPAQRIKMSEATQHDIDKHGRVFRG